MFDSDVKTYDPRKNIVIFGSRQIHGFSKDDIIEVSPQGEGTSGYVGADGEVGRSVDPNECYEVTLHLASSSESNDYLTKCYNYDRQTGRGMLPLSVKDLSGKTRFFARQAWVKTTPKDAKAREINGRDWVLHTGPAQYVQGGND